MDLNLVVRNHYYSTRIFFSPISLPFWSTGPWKNPTPTAGGFLPYPVTPGSLSSPL